MPDSHAAPSAHEREVERARRKARRAAFVSFVEAVFASPPRHPVLRAAARPGDPS